MHDKEFDAVVGDVTITADRSQYVDFTLPFTDMGVGMIAMDDKKNMWIFMKPFSYDLWIASAGFFILTGFVVWLIEHPTNQEFQGSRSQQIGTVLWFSFSTLVYAHREKLENNLSKFVVIIWLFFVLILTSSYTSTLASMMSVKQFQLDPKHSFIGLPLSSTPLHEFVINSLNFRDFRMKQYSSPQQCIDALSKGSKNGGISAIIDEIPYVKLFLSKFANRGFYLTGTMPNSGGFGFVFPKGSRLGSEMSWAIAKLREENKLNKLETMWFYGRDESIFMQGDSSSAYDRALTVDNFRGLFMISGASSISAILIFFLIHLHKRYHHTISNFIVLCWRKTIDSITPYFRKIINACTHLHHRLC